MPTLEEYTKTHILFLIKHKVKPCTCFHEYLGGPFICPLYGQNICITQPLTKSTISYGGREIPGPKTRQAAAEYFARTYGEDALFEELL